MKKKPTKPLKKAPSKPASKPAKKPVMKAAAAKPVKKPVKPAVVIKKKADKPAPAKAPIKKAAPAPTPVVKTAKKPAPVVAAPAAKKPVIKEAAKDVKHPMPAEKVEKEKAPKKDAKATAGKKGRTAKKEEEEIEDDFVPDDDSGHDEIGEYEEELKAVESLDDETEEVVDWALESKEKGEEEVYLTDAEGRRYCRARDCDQAAVVDTYCRYHYLLFWKRIQVRKRILLDGKLEKYIEELTARYPDKFLEMIRRDLRTEKDFQGAIQELEIDEAGLDNENEEDTQTYIDEVRGMGEGSAGSGVEDEEF